MHTPPLAHFTDPHSSHADMANASKTERRISAGIRNTFKETQNCSIALLDGFNEN